MQHRHFQEGIDHCTKRIGPKYCIQYFVKHIQPFSHQKYNHLKRIGNQLLIFMIRFILIHSCCAQYSILPTIMLKIVTTFTPVAGFENIIEKMQITGIMAKLYKNNSRNMMVNSLGLFHPSCWPIANIMMITKMVKVFVKMSHIIDDAQKIGKFTPLTYCKNRALHSFSYKRWTK